MPGQNPELAQPFGARGPHVVLAQDVEDRGARHPRDHRHRRQRQGHRRQDQMRQRSRAADRKPVEPEREDDDQHQARPEDRHGEPEQGAEARKRVEDRVRPHRRGDAGHDAGNRRQHERGQRELEGRRPRVGQLRGDRPVLLDRAAQVAAHDAPDVFEVADEERLVQPEMVAKLGDGVLRGVLAEHQGHRVARQEIDREHDHEHHAEQHGHGEEEAADDERQHPPPPARKPTCRSRSSRGSGCTRPGGCGSPSRWHARR